MSILTKPLPKTVNVAGREMQVRWDHRSMLRIDELLTADIPEEERGMEILKLFYGEIPPDVDDAVSAMLLFFRCGEETDQGEGGGGDGPVRPDFSYQLDANLIYAAFFAQYEIDLAEEPIHWWKFMALFHGLGSDHLFSEVRKCRNVKITKGMTAEQKQYYKAMKKLHALPQSAKERKELDAVTAALMGDGNVTEVLHGTKEE